MLKINDIKEITSIRYKGNDYPVVNANITVDNEHSYDTMFSSESLEKTILNNMCEPKNKTCKAIDDDIYAYLPDEIFQMPEEKIAKYIEENFD